MCEPLEPAGARREGLFTAEDTAFAITGLLTQARDRMTSIEEAVGVEGHSLVSRVGACWSRLGTPIPVATWSGQIEASESLS